MVVSAQGSPKDLKPAPRSPIVARVLSKSLVLQLPAQRSYGRSLRALNNKVPSIFQTHEFAAAGGLLGYDPSLAELYRKAGTYVGRILKGENPGTLPVQESTEFDLVVNRKAAKAIGLSVPTSLLLLAREVIE